jgi:hypothetical protein
VSGHLHHKLSVLHQNLLHGKLPRDVHWADALELVGHLGQVTQSAGVECTFIIGAHREIFKRPKTSELGIEEVSQLRRFLKGAAGGAPAPVSEEPRRMIVVIDHHGAHLFQDLGDGRPVGEVTLEPYDPKHVHHHLIHRKEAHFQGDRVPEELSFYAEVAQALVSAKEIVLIGHGTGKSSAVEFLADYLKKHQPQVSARVVATETADLSALTEPGLEAIAKRHLHPASEN